MKPLKIIEREPEIMEIAYRLPLTFAYGRSEVKAVCDAALENSGVLNLFSDPGSCLSGCARFIGYPALAQLSQDGLIQAGVGITADEMTRRWVDLKIAGGGDSADDAKTLDTISEALRAWDIQALFRQVAIDIGLFGGCLVFIDTGTDPDMLDAPLVVDRLGTGFLRGFRIIEPVCLSPGRYNATDPLRPRFYKPESWFVYGKEVHASHFLYFTSGDLPMLLRPSYNFFGISMAQLALDYLLPFTDSREAAARLLKKFSLTVLKTNLSGFLQGGPTGDIDRRIDFFVQNRSNDGVLAIDKEQEDVVKIETPLSGVTEIVRQALELLAAVFRIPAVKYLGISPGGFNATGESDIRSFYDHIAGQQERLLDKQLKQVLRILSLHTLGKEIAGLTPVWIPLGDDDAEKQAVTKRAEAERDAIYLDRQVLSSDEVRERLAADEDSGYSIKTDKDWNYEDAADDPVTGEGLPNFSIEAETIPRVENKDNSGLLIDVAQKIKSGEITATAGRAILKFAAPDIPADTITAITGEA